ncbi:MAG: hypothetical protein A2Y86_03965 [Candidatus Aminicenantes bacterium RBG_13_62_12]|nr:MAG: hypothetical protein A2Y86_03965 [Candidatus Aminicenantes bacterium RBG_13_62_12]
MIAAGDKGPGWAGRIRRAAALVVILLLAAVLAFVLLRRTGRRERVEPEPSPSSQKVDEKERIRFVEFRGGRERVEFTADRSYRGPDNMYHMVGNVRIIIHGGKDSHRATVSGEEIIHDADRWRYVFAGPVNVDFRGMSFRTSDVVYDRREEMFSTDQRVDVSSSLLQGRGTGLSYSLRNYTAILGGDLALDMKQEQDGTPLSVTGRSLVFYQGTRKGEIEGPVTLRRGRSAGSCRRLDFELFSRTDMLSIIYLRGEASLSLREEPLFPSSVDAGQRSLAALGADQDIKAEEVKIRTFQDSSQIHSFECSGGSSLEFMSPSGDRTRFRAERIDFVFDRQGELREFRSLAGARMDQREAGTGATRSVVGESMIMTGSSDWLLVRPGRGGKARAALDSTEIQADELDFGLERRDLEARGAKVVFTGRDRRQAVGFFAPESPSFVTAEEMRYLGPDRRFFFRGHIRMWQGGKTLTAAEFEFDEDTGRASGRGGVRAVFPHKPKSREGEERVDISARTLQSDPEENRMTFETDARLVLERAEVRARSLLVRLGEEGRELEGITASDDVVIVQGGREGRGRLAVYDEGRDEVVLTGRPVLTEKGKGRVEGDKLTFHLGDGTITVENTGRERSVTVIKS